MNTLLQHSYIIIPFLIPKMEQKGIGREKPFHLLFFRKGRGTVKIKGFFCFLLFNREKMKGKRKPCPLFKQRTE